MSFDRKLERRARRKERKSEAVGGFKVKCKDHGKKPWLGDLVCAKCDTIHLIDDATKEHPSLLEGDVCPCGAPMFPIRDEAGEIMKDLPFFGRIACRDCARKKHAEQQAPKTS